MAQGLRFTPISEVVPTDLDQADAELTTKDYGHDSQSASRPPVK